VSLPWYWSFTCWPVCSLTQVTYKEIWLYKVSIHVFGDSNKEGEKCYDLFVPLINQKTWNMVLHDSLQMQILPSSRLFALSRGFKKFMSLTLVYLTRLPVYQTVNYIAWYNGWRNCLISFHVSNYLDYETNIFSIVMR